MFQFGEKLLLRKKAFFDQELDGGINLDGICDKEFFEGDQFRGIKLRCHG